jgi:hypothetical protein
MSDPVFIQFVVAVAFGVAFGYPMARVVVTIGAALFNLSYLLMCLLVTAIWDWMQHARKAK